MKKILLGLIPVFCCTVSAVEVILPNQPSPAEQTAGRLLTQALKEQGGEWTVGGKKLLRCRVGDSAAAAKSGWSARTMPEESWRIRSEGNELLFIGGGARGTLYAVNEFIFDVLKRYTTSSGEVIRREPRKNDLPKLDRQGKPFFVHRSFYLHNAQDGGGFLSQLKANGAGGRPLQLRYGGGLEYGPPYHCHTFEYYVPAATYLKSNPEYFSEVGGRRVGGQSRGQLCLTHPELPRVFVRKLREYIRQGEAAADKQGRSRPGIYDISMNDNMLYCRCTRCEAAAGEYNQSGVLLRFINRIAREIGKERPDLLISTLAYHYNEEPPHGVQAEPNVVIRLCDTSTNQAASISAKENAMFARQVAAWGKVAKSIFIWDYAITFNETGLPYPSEFHYGDLYRFYADNNVKGIFWEHEHHQLADMYEMKLFMEARLLDQPYADAEALRVNFLNDYYQAAASPIDQARRELLQTFRRNGGRIGWFEGLRGFRCVDRDSLARIQTRFDQAEAKVRQDAALLRRVRRARLGMDRLSYRLARYYAGGQTKEQQTSDRQKFVLPALERVRTYALSLGGSEAGRLLLEETACYADLPAAHYPAASGFAYDFPADELTRTNKKQLLLIDDPEAPNRIVIRMNPSPRRPELSEFPQSAGVYDTARARLIKSIRIDRPAKAGYRTWTIDDVELVPHGYIYIGNSWAVQLPLKFLKEPGRYRVELHLRFGFADAPNAVGVERIVLFRK